MTFYSNTKQKNYVLNPRGKPLYEDSDRFGTKMLEKMGWSKGKGLGANLDGEQNFVRVAHKNDQRGMGFVDRDDQWTQHRDDFNSLLKSLDNSNSGSRAQSGGEEDADGDEDDSNARTGFGFATSEKQKTKLESSIAAKLSGKSLEEQSKSSSARLHYKKFTRGKDLSKYSEKDLANIFGKKSGNEDDSVQEKQLEEPEAEAEKLNFGITTIETGTSIADYFRNKKLKNGKRGADDSNASATGDFSEGEKKKSKDKKKSKKRNADNDITNGDSSVDNNVTAETSFIVEDNVIESDVPIKKKKKKSSKKSEEESPTSYENPNSKTEENESGPLELSQDVSIEKQKKKKKKKNKSSEREDVDSLDAIQEVIDDTQSKSSKKRKRSRHAKEEEEENDSTETPSPEVEPIKKSKKQASAEVTNVQPTNVVSNILSALINNKRKLMGDSSTEASGPRVGCTEAIASMPPYISFGDNIYEINRYHAEVFRFLDLEGFTNSNLCELAGYGYSKNLELKITAKTRDNDKISGFWDHALATKYGADAVKTKKTSKQNKYGIKTLKKKSLFKAI